MAQLDALMQLPCKKMSIDSKIGKDGDSSISDFLTDKKKVSVEDHLIRKENRQLVRWALTSLDMQEQRILMNRFGFSGGKTLTLKEIGQRMNLSRERVRQIEVQAKRKIRRLFAGENKEALPCIKLRPKTTFRNFKNGNNHTGH